MKDSGWLSELWGMVKFNLLFYFLVIGGLIGLSFFIKLDFWLVLGWLWLATFIRLVWLGEKDPLRYFKSLGLIVLIVSLFWGVASFVGWWAIWILLLGFVCWRVYKGWRVLMRSVRFIETTLFGKPLDRESFDKGEKPSIYKKEAKKDVFDNRKM
jgi:hypothetical protein